MDQRFLPQAMPEVRRDKRSYFHTEWPIPWCSAGTKEANKVMRARTKHVEETRTLQSTLKIR